MKNVFGYPEFDAEGEEIPLYLRQRIQRYADGHPGLPDGTRPEEGFCRQGRDRGAASVRNRDASAGRAGRRRSAAETCSLTAPIPSMPAPGEEITVEAQTNAESGPVHEE